MLLNNWPFFEDDEIIASKEVLETTKVNYWTGSQTKDFEKEFAKYIKNEYAIALSNGSIALELAYKSIKQNDPRFEIITTPRTFIATSSSAVLQGLKPVFADVDLETGMITVDTIEPLINKNTLGISVVHLGGFPADMINICNLANKYNLKVIEDCSQAHGAKIEENGTWKSVGSYGDIGTWSFCQDKIMTTGGEGGMVSMNDMNYWDLIWSYKDHGKNYNLISHGNTSNEFKWLHDNLGSNYRLTEFQSAIGRIQLTKLDKWIDLRTKNASILNEKLKNLDLIRLPKLSQNFKNSWYKYYIYLNKECLKSEWNRSRIIKEINNLNLPAFSGSCSEIYLEKCFKNIGITPKQRLKNAKILGETSLMFLVHHTITEDQMNFYADKIYQICKLATK